MDVLEKWSTPYLSKQVSFFLIVVCCSLAILLTSYLLRLVCFIWSCTSFNLKGLSTPYFLREIQNKVKETQAKLYGSYAFNTNKQKETNLKKYGVDNPFKLKEVQDQIKQTNLNKYGFENVSKSKM